MTIKICPIMSNHEGFNFRDCQEDKCQVWIDKTNSCGLIQNKEVN